MQVFDSINPLETALAPHGLMVMGHLPHPDNPQLSIVLVGADRGFWHVFTDAPESRDGLPDPIDRWSKRVLRPMAKECLFPSDGPPYAPFIAWARATNRFWQSPTGMLVHDTVGLMISIRGALIVDLHLPEPTVSDPPCATCVGRPCVTACPIGALSDTASYDVPACKAFIDSEPGTACITQGCATRLACPLSEAFDRQTEQNAFHIRAFRGN